jgi:hypothetical protein
MSNPILNPAVLLSPVETGYVAYDPIADRLHQLNSTAALLAELCDGSRNADEIRQLVAPIMPEGKAEEVNRWVDEAIKAGLLVWQGSDSASLRRQNFHLVKRLKENGSQPAYLCCKRARRIEPGWDAWYRWAICANPSQTAGRSANAFQKYLTLIEDAEINTCS